MLRRIVVLGMFFALLLATVSITTPVIADEEGCVIPESGPWPPCATGGSGGNMEDDCVIPESGPWPPCATGGATPPANNNDDCVIPESGPWPPCATGGNSEANPTPTPSTDASPPPSPTEEMPERFTVTGVTILEKNTYDIKVSLDYAGNTDPDYVPFLVIFDPDNCFDLCHQRHLLDSYPIDGQATLESTEASGTFEMAVDIDGLICPYQPRTDRLVLAVVNKNLLGRQTVLLEILGVIEDVDHVWCQ